MLFSYRALSPTGALITDTLEAGSSGEAAETLRAKRLTILELSSAQTNANRAPRRKLLGGGNARNLQLLAHQMEMLLESGASVVPALDAIEKQCGDSPFGHTLRSVREHVENGGSLTEGFQQHPRIFKRVFCTIIAAGEATATLPAAFGRIAKLLERQRQVRKTIVGAVTYPAVLAFMCINVVGVLIGFVLPRFRGLFEMLNTPLPTSTKMMFAVSNAMNDHWPMMLAGVLLPIIALVALWMQPAVRAKIDILLLRVPWVGRMVARLLFARVLRIWAAMLRCHVPLIETVKQSRKSVQNGTVVALVKRVEESIAGGGRIGEVLREDSLVDPVVTAAIATGEENGKLTEAVDFVSDWLDQDNQQMVTVATRILEPTLLALMGLVVGIVAMSLFLPLFDMATAGG